MHINLTELFSQTTNDVRLNQELDLKALTFGKDTYQIETPIMVDLELTKLGAGDFLAQGKISTELIMYCSRCMNNVITKVEADISKELKMASKNSDENDDDEDSYEYLDGTLLNLEKLVLDEIYMNVPMKVLCREDCEGICKTCGTNLNHATCNCEDDNVDPRLAGLKDLFNEQFKEV